MEGTPNGAKLWLHKGEGGGAEEGATWVVFFSASSSKRYSQTKASERRNQTFYQPFTLDILLKPVLDRNKKELSTPFMGKGGTSP